MKASLNEKAYSVKELLQKTAIELLHLFSLFVTRRVGELDDYWRRAAFHSLRVVHGLDGINGALPLQVCDKRTASTFHVRVAQNRAVFNLAIWSKHYTDVLFFACPRDHTDEEFTLVSVLCVGRLHLNRMMHACQCDQVVQCVLGVQCRFTCVERYETAALFNKSNFFFTILTEFENIK